MLKVAALSTVISVSCKDLDVENFTGYKQTSRLAFVLGFTWYRRHFPASGPVGGENTHLSLIVAGSILIVFSILASEENRLSECLAPN